ncbi:hypothetical protein E4T47_03697 [Aureobasidium subglaciale]|nr:hypothetical protein E4T43_02891 [Aureobasidium subglaciale]KAI5273157.1 hypothetical protein E4T47_03697 [Aureobasidium subglaciale]
MTTDTTILITAGPYQFLAMFENDAPDTVAVFRTLLPYRQKIIHVRWSGEAVWIPLGDADFQLGFENHTAHPAAGQILFYPGGFSETELLFCYGNVAFASKMGALAANHFLTVTEGAEDLKALGKLVLWEGAQDVVFELADQARRVPGNSESGVDKIEIVTAHLAMVAAAQLRHFTM